MNTTDLPITADMNVNETVQRYPDTLPHFAALGIDTCCGGAKPIEEAARRHGADPDRLLARLNEAALAAASTARSTAAHRRPPTSCPPGERSPHRIGHLRAPARGVGR